MRSVSKTNKSCVHDKSNSREHSVIHTCPKHLGTLGNNQLDQSNYPSNRIVIIQTIIYFKHSTNTSIFLSFYFHKIINSIIKK